MRKQCPTHILALFSKNNERKWDGTIIGVGYGSAVIVATTTDGGHVAICTMTVSDGMAIDDVPMEGKSYKVYDLKGIEQTKIQRGINIIQFKDGSMEKVLIK